MEKKTKEALEIIGNALCNDLLKLSQKEHLLNVAAFNHIKELLMPEEEVKEKKTEEIQK